MHARSADRASTVRTTQSSTRAGIEYGETRVVVCERGYYFTEPEFIDLTREHVEQVRRIEQARSMVGRHLAKRHASGRA